MAHLHRFYVPADLAAGREIELPPEEAHHALHVVRVRVNDPVGLFDGCGCEVAGIIKSATRNAVIVSADEERRVPSPTPALILIQAWLHRDKAIEELIRRGTELGVGTFRFFRAKRSERPLEPHAKWTRMAIESCKQCGQAWLPTFEVAKSLEEALGKQERDDPSRLQRLQLLVATADVAPTPLRVALGDRRDAVGLIIGPEGDLTPEELQCACEHGATPISLGSATFRSEVAAVSAVTVILYELGRLGPLLVS